MLQRAEMLHDQLDEIKEMALGSSSELAQEAAHVDDDEAVELREASRALFRVYQRINYGDSNLLRKHD